MQPLMYQLLCNHLLQFIFLKNFYDENRMVNTKNKWVWIVNMISYVYILFKYDQLDDQQDSDNLDLSVSSQIWIPLDCILTFNIMLYQVFYYWQEQ